MNGPLAPLAAADLDFAVVNYDFTSLTADELSSLPSLEAGIDADLADFAASIADQTTLIASMEGDLDDLSVILAEIDTDELDTILEDFALAAELGSSLLDTISSGITDAGIP